jgi:hypothetical protein
MLYLSGVTNKDFEEAARLHPLGLLTNPGNSTHLRVGRFSAFAVDNGCFSLGDRFNLPDYFRYLEAFGSSGRRALFATAPDVLGDPEATFARSLPVLPEIRARGFKAALVAQDGLELLSIPWEAFDVLFIGGRPQPRGTEEWKLGAGCRALVAAAKARKKVVHMGRVNSAKRYRYAASIGCDSADGTFLGYSPSTNLGRLLRWFETPGLRAAA